MNGAELKVLLLIPSIIQVAQSQNELPAVLNLTPANLLASYCILSTQTEQTLFPLDKKIVDYQVCMKINLTI